MGKRILCGLAAILLVGLLSTEASALRASGTFSYSESSSTVSGVTTKSSRFMQSYSAGIKHKLTDTIDLGLDIMWYFVDSKSGNVSSSDSSYSPVVTLNFTPPGLYRFKFGHSRTDSLPSEGQHITNAITYSSFILPQTRWPSLNLSYNISENFNHTSPKSLDVKTTTLGVSSGYSFEARGGTGSVSYRFGDNLTEDNPRKVSSETVSHSLGVSYSKSFMNDKLDMSVSANISESTQTHESKGVPTRFLLPLTSSNGLVCAACVGTLGIETELLDNNTTTPVTPTIDIANPNWHIGIDTGVVDVVSGLYVYVSTTPVEENLIVITYDFQWQLYESADNIVWTSMGAVTPVYDTFYNRFRFDFGADTTNRYFKVVNTAGNGAAIDVTEISAFSYLLATPKNKAEDVSDANSMSLHISYKGKRGRASYNLGFSQSSRDLNDSESTSITQGLNGSYTVVPRYLSLLGAASSSKSKSSNRGSKENVSDVLSYRLSLSSTPLPSIRGAMSYNHNENHVNGVKYRQSETFGVSTSVDVYRGVDVRLSFSDRKSENLVANTRSTSKTTSANLRLRPWSTVTINLLSGANKSSSKWPTGSLSSSSESLSGNISIRFTRKLYYSGLFNFEPSQSERHSVGWRLTRLLNATASHSSTDFNRAKSLNLNWAPIPRAGFSFGFSESEQLSSGTIVESMYVRAHVLFL